jgi:hypothetical protein
MKKLIITLMLAGVVSGSFAQYEKTLIPEPSRLPEVRKWKSYLMKSMFR